MSKQQKQIVKIVVLTLFTILFATAMPPRFSVIRELKTPDLTTTQYQEPTVAESVHYEVAEPEPDIEHETTVEPTEEHKIDLYALSYDELNTYSHSEISKYLYPTEPTTESEPTPERYILTDDEKDMIMFVAYNEDRTSVESLLAVMQTIMNRVESDRFPDTVTEVLTQPKQFQVIRRYSGGDCPPSKEALQALELLLYGEDIFDGRRALYFAEKSVSPSRIARGLELVALVGGSKFWEQK